MCKGYGELAVDGKVVRCLMATHGYHYLMHIPCAAPGSIHSIRFTVLVVRADNQHRLWKHPWF